MRVKCVYLAYTSSPQVGRELLKVYSKSHYQMAFNWLMEIKERSPKRTFQVGQGKIAVEVHDPIHNQVWWLEKWEVQ